MVGSSITMTSCSDKEKKFGGIVYTGPTKENAYIIIEQNDTDILHKGDFYKSVDGTMNGFELRCGEGFFSNADCSVYEEEPKENRYDEVCEECIYN